jgi:hypothetical protein
MRRLQLPLSLDLKTRLNKIIMAEAKRPRKANFSDSEILKMLEEISFQKTLLLSAFQNNITIQAKTFGNPCMLKKASLLAFACRCVGILMHSFA